MTKAYDFDIKATDKTRAAFESVNKNINKTNNEFGKFSKKTSKGIGGVGRSSGQASIQVQQMIGQIQGGVNPMVALSQQSADLGFVLGVPLLGAVVSIAAALGTMLLPNLFKTGESTEGLSEKIKTLRGQYILTSEQLALLSSEEQKEIKEKRTRITQIETEIKKLEELQRIRTSPSFGADLGEGAFEEARTAEQNQKRFATAISETQSELIKLNAELSTTKQEIGDISRISDSSEIRDSLVADLRLARIQLLGTSEEAERLKFALSSGFDSFQKLPKDVQDLYNSLLKTNSALKEQVETTAASVALEAKRASALDSVNAALQNQIIGLEMGEKAAYEYGVAQKLGLETTELIPAAIQAQIDKLYELKDVQTEVSEGGFWENLRGHIESTSGDFDTMWGNSFDRFAQGIGDSTAAAIVEGQNFGDTMKTFARSAVQEVISGLIQIGVKRLALSGIESALTVKSTAETLAATTAIAGTTAAAMAPAAAATSLATAGTNSAPAISGMTLALAAAAGIFALSSFDGGGYTGDGARIGGMDGKGGRLAMIHPREYITDFTKGQSMGGTSISMPITINGNADSETIDQLKRQQKKFGRYVQTLVGKPV